MKRISVLFLCLAILLCGCGGTSNGTKPAETRPTGQARSKPFEITEPELLFAGALTEAEFGAEQESFFTTCVDKDQIAILSTKPGEAPAAEGMPQMFTDCLTTMDRSTLETDSFSFSQWEVADGGQFLCMDFQDDTHIMILVQYPAAQVSYGLITFDTAAKAFSEVIPLDISLDSDAEGVDLICTEDGGVLASFSDGTIFWLDMETNRSGAFSCGLFSPMFVRDAENQIFLVGYDAGYVAACSVAPAEHTAGGSVSMLSGDWVRVADGCYGYDFFLAEDNTIYGVTLQNKTLTPIFDGFQSGVDLNHIAFFSVGDRILICDNRSMDLLADQYVLLIAEAAENGAKESRKELRLATLDMDSYLQEAISTFNRTNENYVISVENYSQYGDGGVARMKMDLMSGDLPDIINLAGFRGTAIDSETYLLDLLPYVQTSFGENMEPLQRNVVDALTRDGTLPYIAPIYHMETIITAKTDTYEPLTLGAFEALLETGDHEYLTNEAVLSALIRYGIHDIVHTEEQTMDTNALRSMLEIANRYPGETVPDETSSAQRLLSGAVPFLEEEIFSLRNFRTLYYNMGDGFQIYGYPGRTEDSVQLYSNIYLAITTSASEPSGAWEFIVSTLDPDLQEKYSFRSFPLLKSCLEDQIKEAEATDYGFSEEEQRLLDAMIDHIGEQAVYPEDVYQIILEEAERYFSGDAALDDAVKAADQRVSVYMSEQN